jgi:hypothetical protein
MSAEILFIIGVALAIYTWYKVVKIGNQVKKEFKKVHRIQEVA